MSRALVLAGGGAKGSWQLGAVEKLSNQGLDFDVIAGVSTGALSAAILAQGKGSAGLQIQVQRLKALYLGLRGDRDVYRPRFINATLSQLAAFVFKSSIYDPAPIFAKVDAQVTASALKASGKLLRVGAVSFASGQYRTATEKDADVIDMVKASASMEVFFPPIMPGYWYDGGNRHTTPLADAFEAIASLPVGTEPPEMYIVLCDTIPAFGPSTEKFDRAPAQIARGIDMMTSQIYVDDLISACLANNDALAGQPRKLSSGRFAQYVKLFVLAPEPGTPLPDTLEFSPAKLRAAIASGANAVVHDQGWLSKQLGLS